MIQDFDITQISKDTKAIVFRVPFSVYICDEKMIDLMDSIFNNISNKLSEQGITAIFIDESISVTPLTDDLINTSELKVVKA